jgi:hypothetical protein
VTSRKVRKHESSHREEREPVSEKTRRSRTLRDLPSYSDRQDELVTNPVILLTQRATALPPPLEDDTYDSSLEELATLARGSAPPPRISPMPRLLAPVAPVAPVSPLANFAPTLVPPVAASRQPSSIPALTVSGSSAPGRPSTFPPRRRAGDDGGRGRGLGTVILSATVGAIVALGMWTVRSGLDRAASAKDGAPFPAATASASDDKCVSPSGVSASSPATASTAAVSAGSTPESEKPVSFDALPRAYGASTPAGTTRAASHRSATSVTTRASGGSVREAPRPAVQRARVSPRVAVTDAVQRASYAARSCESGPQNGKVEVTFSPTGAVSSVALIKGFDDAGVNGCVLRAFGRVRVSPFEGDPISVRKTVSW